MQQLEPHHELISHRYVCVPSVLSIPILISGACLFVVPVCQRRHLCGKPDGIHLRLHKGLDRTHLRRG